MEELESCLSSPETVESEIALKELTHIIENFLDSLSTENRVIFLRRYWFSDTYSDIAARVGMTEKNVSVRLTRIREKLRNYLTEREVLALVENSSGKHKGETTISRRGRKRLRYLLFEVAMSLVSKNQEFRELHNYYTTRRLNPLKKMQSLMAIAAKLIRVFYAMLTKGVNYDPKKMVSDIKRPAVYLQAA